MNLKFIALAALMLGNSIQAASASEFYSNPWNNSSDGSCAWASCGGGPGTAIFTNFYQAQLFSISTPTTALAASLTEVDYNFQTAPQTTLISWMILSSNGAGGLPGTVISSGTSSVFSTTKIGPTSDSIYLTGYTDYFNISTTPLSTGSYYLAIHGSTTSDSDYLGAGTATGGVASSTNGGTTWIANGPYATLPSVAISIFDTAFASAVPEPSTWAMMILGFFGVGFMVYPWREERDASRLIKLRIHRPPSAGLSVCGIAKTIIGESRN
jgi:hypothetical protein